jgi:hypothetical protein
MLIQKVDEEDGVSLSNIADPTGTSIPPAYTNSELPDEEPLA